MILHTDIQGDGEPILLLHGMAASARYWDPLISLFKSSNRVITMDLLGYGRSPMPKNVVYDYETHIKAITDTLKSLNINQPVILVSHSMGALIALRLARQHPELVEKLVTIGMPIYDTDFAARQDITRGKKLPKLVYYGWTSKTLCTLWCGWLQPISRHIAPLYLRHVPKKVAQDSVMHTWQSYSESLHHIIEHQDVSGDIKQIKLPVSMVYGDQDRSAHASLLGPLQKKPNIKTIELKGTHQIVHEQPEEIAKIVTR